ncbi:Uncharacterised protein [Mycobacteroides abscessus subsp. abscessus]|nr:Uncharacterised protein [Mycobacteroides abscessus subsp. abscessus]
MPSPEISTFSRSTLSDSRAAAMMTGCATAVSRKEFSSLLAVTKSNLTASDQMAMRSRAVDRGSQGSSMPGFCTPCPGDVTM